MAETFRQDQNDRRRMIAQCDRCDGYKFFIKLLVPHDGTFHIICASCAREGALEYEESSTVIHEAEKSI